MGFVSASSKLGICRDSECSVELVMGSAELTTRTLSEVNIVDHETVVSLYQISNETSP